MQAGSILGHPVRRVEDPGLITGSSRFVDDIAVDGAVYAVFVRSTLAHARIARIDTEQAVAMAGVAGVFTAADLTIPPIGSGAVSTVFARPILATDVVRFVGEPVAVVLAETREQAADAAEEVLVDYDPLPVVVDAERAMEASSP